MVFFSCSSWFFCLCAAWTV